MDVGRVMRTVSSNYLIFAKDNGMSTLNPVFLVKYETGFITWIAQFPEVLRGRLIFSTRSAYNETAFKKKSHFLSPPLSPPRQAWNQKK
jgi:hypothetical protein